MTTNTTKTTIPACVERGSLEEKFLICFNARIAELWFVLDEAGLFDTPGLKEAWQTMQQHWEGRPFLHYPPSPYPDLPDEEYHLYAEPLRLLPRRRVGFFRRVFYALFG